MKARLRLEKGNFIQEMADYKYDRGDLGWTDIWKLTFVAIVHRLFKVTAEKRRRVGLKRKKEGRKAEREKWHERINKSKENSRKSVG